MTTLKQYGNSDDGTLAGVSRAILDRLGGTQKLGETIATRYEKVSQGDDNDKIFLEFSRFLVKTIESKDRLDLDSMESELDDATLRAMIWPLFEEKLKTDDIFCRWILDTLRDHQPALFDRLLAESQARLIVEGGAT